MSSEFSQIINAIDKVRSRRALKYSNYTLTTLGKEKAEEYGGEGREFEVLNDLNDNGPSTLREICGRTHMEEKIAKAVLRGLEAKGRVTKVAR